MITFARAYKVLTVALVALALMVNSAWIADQFLLPRPGDADYQAVATGMTRAEVEDILGSESFSEPIAGNRFLCTYRGRDDAGSLQYNVVFDRTTNRVVAKGIGRVIF